MPIARIISVPMMMILRIQTFDRRWRDTACCTEPPNSCVVDCRICPHNSDHIPGRRKTMMQNALRKACSLVVLTPSRIERKHESKAG
jgi:hypothetical protein